MKTARYVDWWLVELLPAMSEKQIKKLNNMSMWDWETYKLIDETIFQASDEMDWELSECCGAEIRNWLCSDCKEHC